MIVKRKSSFTEGQTKLIYVVFVERLGDVESLAINSAGLSASIAGESVSVSVTEVVKGLVPVMQSRYYSNMIVNASTLPSNGSVFLSNLAEGLNYHVRVAAWNGVGGIYGVPCESSPALTRPSKPPSLASNVIISPLDDTTVTVSWNAPTSSGGSPVSSYIVEYDYPSSELDIQTVQIRSASSSLTGTFCLSFMGDSTGEIDADTSESRFKSLLESLPGIGKLLVAVDRSNTFNSSSEVQQQWKIIFLDNVGPLPLLQSSCNTLVGVNVSIAVSSVQQGIAPSFSTGMIGILALPLGRVQTTPLHTVQMITVNASSSDLDGEFYVFNSGELSAPISVYSTAEDMQSALESMLTISSVNVSVIDHSLTSTERVSNYGRSWLITFLEMHSHSLLVSAGHKTGTCDFKHFLFDQVNLLAYLISITPRYCGVRWYIGGV